MWRSAPSTSRHLRRYRWFTLSAQPRHVRKDQTIGQWGVGAVAMCLVRFSGSEGWNPEKEEVLVFLKNQFRLRATTTAAIDKGRWQIDLCFKALNRNRDIMTFVRASANAVKIHAWTALIAMVSLRYR